MSRTTEGVMNLDLTTEEWWLLEAGLNEWRGPARCTDALAKAMAFASAKAFLAEIEERLLPRLERRRGLTRPDWKRILIATEIAFVSDVVGSGLDWSTTVGLTDEETIALLRGVQRKILEGCAPSRDRS